MSDFIMITRRTQPSTVIAMGIFFFFLNQDPLNYSKITFYCDRLNILERTLHNGEQEQRAANGYAKYAKWSVREFEKKAPCYSVSERIHVKLTR